MFSCAAACWTPRRWAVLLMPGVVAIAYREDPARFHGDVDKRLVRMMLGAIVAVAVRIALAKTRVI